MHRRFGSLIFLLCFLFCVLTCAYLPACTSSSTSNDSVASTEDIDLSALKLIADGKLTIGSDLDYEPMCYTDNEAPAGFEIEMMDELCNRIGLKANYIAPQDFDTLVTQVAAGTSIDVAVAAITINDDRSELVDFSDPYFDANQVVVVRADAVYEDVSELDGQSVAAESGTTGETWAKENWQDSSYEGYTSIQDALAALKNGKVEALVFDSSAANYDVKNDESLKILDEINTAEQYGIAVNKDNPALTQAINLVLSDMEYDGTMDELKEEWFGSTDAG